MGESFVEQLKVLDLTLKFEVKVEVLSQKSDTNGEYWKLSTSDGIGIELTAIQLSRLEDWFGRCLLLCLSLMPGQLRAYLNVQAWTNPLFTAEPLSIGLFLWRLTPIVKSISAAECESLVATYSSVVKKKPAGVLVPTENIVYSRKRGCPPMRLTWKSHKNIQSLVLGVAKSIN